MAELAIAPFKRMLRKVAPNMKISDPAKREIRNMAEICHGCPERRHRDNEDIKEENRDGGRHKDRKEAVSQDDLIV